MSHNQERAPNTVSKAVRPTVSTGLGAEGGRGGSPCPLTWMAT
jgi:hypothetical protein